MVRIRKRFRVLLLSSIVAAIVVPVGFALSLPSGSSAPHARGDGSDAVTSSVALAVPALVTADGPRRSTFLEEVPDAAKLFFVGTLLVGVATAMRKAG